jgi:hypothetical protein
VFTLEFVELLAEFVVPLFADSDPPVDVGVPLVPVLVVVCVVGVVVLA